MEEIADTTELEETYNPVQLIFNSAPDGYVMSLEDRESLVQFMNTMLGDILDDPFVLVEASYAGRLDQYYNKPSLPLIITLRGPSHISPLALSYVIQVIEDNIRAIESFLKRLDAEVFDVSFTLRHSCFWRLSND